MSLKALAVSTLELVERGTYTAPSGAQVDFGAAQRAAVEGSRVFAPDTLEALRTAGGAGSGVPAIEVVDATTQVGAQPLAPDVLLLNFASARNPGGGFLRGAKAQEEDLCRCSGLYPCLTPFMDAYYQVNRRHPDNLYTDTMIYSPQVPFFRVRGRGDLLETPFLTDVITAPAPNRGASRDTSEAVIAEVFERRWGQVLALARHVGRRTLLLGAWGCGAFHNTPETAAETFLDALAGFGGAFDRIVFAIPNSGKRSAANYAVFRRILESAD